MTTATDPSEQAPLPRSSFVTGLAWIFIALAGFSTLIAVLQNVMISLFFPIDEIRTAAQEMEKGPPMPWFAKFMMEHMHQFFLLLLILSALTLVSAIGLLRRQNWARLIFIGVMGVGIIWNVGGMIMPFFIFPLPPPIPAHAPAEFQDHFDIMMKVMIAFGVVIGLTFSVLFGWIIKRLASKEIRGEFSGV